MKNKKLAVERILDSVWTIEYESVLGGVFIHSYNRNNQVGYEQEQDLPKGRLIENNGKHSSDCNGERIVTGLSIGGEIIDVVNPQYVFSYGE